MIEERDGYVARDSAMLCRQCARNLGFWEAWRAVDCSGAERVLWATVRRNFHDMVVFDWCRLFGVYGGGAAWFNWLVAGDQKDAVLDGLCAAVGMNGEEFATYAGSLTMRREVGFLEFGDFSHILPTLVYVYDYVERYMLPAEALQALPTPQAAYEESVVIGRAAAARIFP